MFLKAKLFYNHGPLLMFCLLSSDTLQGLVFFDLSSDLELCFDGCCHPCLFNVLALRISYKTNTETITTSKIGSFITALIFFNFKSLPICTKYQGS